MKAETFMETNHKFPKGAKADSFTSHVIGKTSQELFHIKKEDYPIDLIAAAQKAIDDRNDNRFSASNIKIKLSCTSKVDKTTTNSTKTSNGFGCFFSYFSSVVIDDEVKILSVLLDSIKPKIPYDNNGNVFKANFEGSLHEIGEKFVFCYKLIGLKNNEIVFCILQIG